MAAWGMTAVAGLFIKQRGLCEVLFQTNALFVGMPKPHTSREMLILAALLVELCCSYRVCFDLFAKFVNNAQVCASQGETTAAGPPEELCSLSRVLFHAKAQPVQATQAGASFELIALAGHLVK